MIGSLAIQGGALLLPFSLETIKLTSESDKKWSAKLIASWAFALAVILAAYIFDGFEMMLAAGAFLVIVGIIVDRLGFFGRK